MKSTELLSNQFKDSTGHTWTVGITVGSYMKIKSELGIDVTDVASENSWIQDLALSEDIVTLMSMVVIILQPALDKAGVSMEEFFDRIGAEECDALLSALIGGVVNFTPAHKQEPLVRAIVMMQTKAEKAAQKVLLLLEDRSEKVDKEMEAQFQSMIQKPLNPSSSTPQE
jgi:hypothetical protein